MSREFHVSRQSIDIKTITFAELCNAKALKKELRLLPRPTGLKDIGTAVHLVEQMGGLERAERILECLHLLTVGERDES